MGLGQLLRIDSARGGGIAAGMMMVGLTSACEREPDFDPPSKIQVVCTAPTTSTAAPPSAPTSPPPTAGSIVLVLDTGDDRVRWANGPGAPTGVLTVEDQQYVLAFTHDRAKPWRATLNRFDGTMVREVGKPGAARTRELLACKREAEGPKL